MTGATIPQRQPLTVPQWREANGAYLAAGLEWLRRSLSAAAARDDAPSSEQVGQALDAVRAAEQTVPPPALVLLGQALDLTRFETDVVLLAAATELDTRTGALCAAAHGDVARAYPTFALAMSLLADPEWSALSPTGALRSWRLVEPDAASSEPLILRPLRIDERVVHFVKGHNVLDERIARLVGPAIGGTASLPPSQAGTVKAALAATADGEGGLLQLVGRNRASRRAVAREVAGQLRLVLYEMPAAALSDPPASARDLARLWHRESRLLPVALLVTAEDGLTAGQAAAARQLAGSAGSPVFLSLDEVCADLLGSSSVHDVRTPVPDEQRTAWAEGLGPDHAELAGRLAAELDLDAGEIDQVARDARQSGDGIATRAWSRALALIRPGLDSLAERLTPIATWDDLVLAEEPSRLLRSVAAQAKHRAQVYDEWGWRARSARGLGITALFAGESGTGKTMAGEVLANELGLDLYRIDLAGVVSKYIGETEKNLRRLFDAAERGGVLLFFDEADALFGKRSEVRDSHDRYANIEVNYLLQRMESYRGLAILASNMRGAMDAAFTRRLRFVVPFPLPARAERERMWRQVFPAAVPTRDLDPARLSKVTLSGALIHTAALHASFGAAEAGTPVTTDLVLDAIRRELRKAERSTKEVEGI